MVHPADYVVAGALKAIEKNKPVFVPGLVYKALTLLSQFIPRELALVFARKTNKGFRRELEKGESA